MQRRVPSNANKYHPGISQLSVSNQELCDILLESKNVQHWLFICSPQSHRSITLATEFSGCKQRQNLVH
jgi:hypothetical protein